MLALLLLFQFTSVIPADGVLLSANPEKICATDAGATYLNFDLIVTNRNDKDLIINIIQASSRNRGRGAH